MVRKERGSSSGSDAVGTSRPPVTLTAYATLGLLGTDFHYTAVETLRRARTYLRHFYWTPALSHIRRELDRLEEMGWVESREIKRGRLMRSLKYWLTPAGLAEVQRWAADGDSFDPPMRKNSAILKVWLGRRSEDPEAVLVAFDRQVDYIRKERAELREHMKDMEAGHTNAVALAGVAPAGPAEVSWRSTWHLEVMRYCLRDYDNELRNLKQLRAGLQELVDARKTAAGGEPIAAES